LTGGHAAVVITTATEQKFTRFLASGFDVIVDRLPRLLRQLESDGPTGLLLPDCGAINRIPARCNVLDPKCDDIGTGLPLTIRERRLSMHSCRAVARRPNSQDAV
jgi:hypothetical protein